MISLHKTSAAIEFHSTLKNICISSSYNFKHVTLLLKRPPLCMHTFQSTCITYKNVQRKLKKKQEEKHLLVEVSQSEQITKSK